MLAAISEVPVALATRARNDHRTEAAKAVQVEQRRCSACEREVRRHVPARWPRQAVVEPSRSLQCKGVERRRQRGGSEQHASGGKDDAEETLRMRILLWSVDASERLVDLSSREELAKVMGDKRAALIAAHDQRLEAAMEPHESSHLRGERLQRGSGDGRRHVVRGIDATIARAGIDAAAVTSEAVKDAGQQGAREVHVEHGCRRRLSGVRDRATKERDGTRTTARD